MRRSQLLWTLRTLLTVAGLLLTLGTAHAQFAGARGGLEALEAAGKPELLHEVLRHQAVDNYITIEGKAEIRVDPTALRIVLAILVDGTDAAKCQDACRKREEDLLKALDRLGIKREAICVDFISILPMYRWEIETREGQKLAVETLSGFRMQSNVHVEVATEDEARKVLAEAFKLGIADVIAFDYWNKDLDRYRVEARQDALRAARQKADLLLGEVFEDRPRPLNVDESTQVVYPRSLYESFESTYAEELSLPYQERLPRVRAARPKNTYYRGFLEDADVRAQGLPLRPQISVISRVRLYYAAPREKRAGEGDREQGDKG